MGKDFLNLKISYNYKKISRVVFCIGIMGTSLLTVQAFNNTKLPNGNEVLKSEAGEGIFEQELIAVIGEEKIPLTLEVEERKITEKEAEEILLNAERALNGILKGSNENLENISREIKFQGHQLRWSGLKNCRNIFTQMELCEKTWRYQNQQSEKYQRFCRFRIIRKIMKRC